MPAAWAYLAAVWLLSLLCGKSWLSFQEIASCLLFYRNFMSSGQLTVFAGHFWSLSMEEQFYIAWPSLLLFAGFRKTRVLAVAGIVAVALFRFFNWGHYDCIWLSFQTQVRADALLVGCLLAMSLSNAEVRAAVSRWARFGVLPALAVLFYCIAMYHWLPPLVECISIALLIAASTLHPRFRPGQAAFSAPVHVARHSLLQHLRLAAVLLRPSTPFCCHADDVHHAGVRARQLLRDRAPGNTPGPSAYKFVVRQSSSRQYCRRLCSDMKPLAASIKRPVVSSYSNGTYVAVNLRTTAACL